MDFSSVSIGKRYVRADDRQLHHSRFETLQEVSDGSRDSTPLEAPCKYIRMIANRAFCLYPNTMASVR